MGGRSVAGSAAMAWVSAIGVAAVGVAAIGVAAALAGCRPTDPVAPVEGVPPAERVVPAERLGALPADAPRGQASGAERPADDPDRWEAWDALYIEDAKIGYIHTRSEPVEQDGEWLVRIEALLEMQAHRWGDASSQTMTLASLETRAGQLVRFDAQLQLSAEPLVVQGWYDGGQLQVEVESSGRRDTSRIDWEPAWGGLFAPEQSLRREPLAVGETRVVRHLKAPTFIPGETRIEAQRHESTELLEGSRELLRARSIETMGDVRIESVIWLDEDGIIRKQQLPGLNQISYRTTPEAALADIQGADLGQRLVVPVARRLDDPHATTRIVYHARLQEADPAELFPGGATQSVRGIDSRTARIEVQAARPEQLSGESVEESPPGPDALQATSFIQSDDPLIVQMAAAAAPEGLTGPELARRLERYVYESMDERNYSQAMATAAEVARTLEGDCTEHAVLLAALCRARGIPARVALGLVYFPQADHGGFAYHMWTEAWADGRWLPLDATLGRGGIGAAHVKLSDSTLDGPAALVSYLQLHQVLGQLQLEIVEVQ